jgi:predicted SAM-dependent methyltransferase
MKNQTDRGVLSRKQRLGKSIFGRLPITRFLFDQIRAEVNAFAMNIGNAVLPWRRSRLRSVRAARDVRANIACGPFAIAGFLNFDLFALDPRVIGYDCRRGVPLADRAAIGIRVEHFVEHLEPRQELPAFLKDCHRALQPGGTLRIIVPDAGRFLRAYCRNDNDGFRELAFAEPFPDDLPTRMDVVNHVFHQWHEHRWGYDFDTLAHRLKSAGFARVEQAAYRESRHDAALAAGDREVHAPYSLYVEAVK